MAAQQNTERSSGASPAASESYEHPPIKAIKLRHPVRWVIAVIIVTYAVAFVVDAAVNRPVYDWETFGKFIFDKRISEAALVTLELTIFSMVLAIALGIALAVMRLSPNPIFKSISWFYLWLFRGTPVYVQLVFWGLLATVYPTLMFGLPFGTPFFEIPTEGIPVFWIAVVGLGMNEAAYMAEIVRAGILSVDKGQEEASKALGMTWFQTMVRVVLPQSMRIIIPPTGNEVISMLKTTSLVAAVPFSLDLYMRARDIAGPIFKPIPLLLVASAWYLLFTSLLMIGQYYLEKRFARGATGMALTRKQIRAEAEQEKSDD
jgi:polar amino acid transport system permease protein